MGALKPWHIIIIVVAFLLLFGFKRLPDAARSLGRSMRIFKSEVKELQAERQGDTPIAPPVQQVASERVQAPVPPASPAPNPPA